MLTGTVNPHEAGVSLEGRHWTNWPAVRVILTALTDHLEIDVQFKAICSPVKTSYLPVENF